MSASPRSTSSIPSSSIPPNKLKVGDTFKIQGPSVYRDITPPDNYPPPAPDSFQPPRPIHRALIGPQGLAQSSAEWEVKVLEIPPPTSSTLAQHVKAEIRKVGSKSSESYAVQLNLSHYSLPRFKYGALESLAMIGSFRNTYPEVDAGHFNTYRNLQGREVMICYGTYTVNLGGSQVIATIVEDVLSESSTVAGWVEAIMGAVVLGVPQATVTFSSGPFRGMKLSQSLLEAKINSDFACLRRILACEPAFLPEIDFLKTPISRYSNLEEIHYMFRIRHASMSIEYLKGTLEQSYYEYCSSSANKSQPTFKPRDFQLHLPGLILAVTNGSPLENAVVDWKEIFKVKERYNLSWNDSLPLVD
ncbi:hypothetical protein JCM3765_004830 [Sporobolomyces pararoseus]